MVRQLTLALIMDYHLEKKGVLLISLVTLTIEMIIAE